MTGTHRSPPRASRRTVLGLAAAGTAAAVSGVAYGVHHRRSGRSPTAQGPATGAPPGGNPPAGATSAPAVQPVPQAASAPATPAAPGRGSTGGPVPARAGKVMLGAYLDLSGETFAQSLALRRRQLGRDERIMHVFYGWGDTLPTRFADRPRGAIPMVSWRGTGYQEILDGSADRIITAAARNLAQLKMPTLLRWGWEMNGDWYPWGGDQNGGDPAGYASCWRYLHKIFQAQGADNVAWVWSVNWNSKPNTADNRYQAYYPGDRYVDWIGVSGYDLHDEDPATLFDPIYQAYAGRKPLFVTECGAVDRGGTTMGDWIRAFARYLRQRPAFAAVTWFDTDTHKDAPNWRIDANVDALAAYRAMATDPYFSG